MSIDLSRDKGTPVSRQRFTWKELVQPPYSKLDDDAFTRVRVILMNGIEAEALRFQHACARMNRDAAARRSRRCGASSSTSRRWSTGSTRRTRSPLETTHRLRAGGDRGHRQRRPERARPVPGAGLPLRPARGLRPPVPLLARCWTGSRARTPTTSSRATPTSCPGRPTAVEHRAPEDDLRRPYDRTTAAPLTKLHALTIMAGRAPDARLLHDHRARCSPTRWRASSTRRSPRSRSSTSPSTSRSSTRARRWLEKWLLHEASEVYNYYSCVRVRDEPAHQGDLGALPRLRARPPRTSCASSSSSIERRDPAEVLPDDAAGADRASRASASSCARCCSSEVDLRANGTEFVRHGRAARAAPLARLPRAAQLGGLALRDRRRRLRLERRAPSSP